MAEDTKKPVPTKTKRVKTVEFNPELSEARWPQTRVDYLLQVGLGDLNELAWYKKTINDPAMAANTTPYRQYLVKLFEQVFGMLVEDQVIYNRAVWLLQRHRHFGEQMDEALRASIKNPGREKFITDFGKSFTFKDGNLPRYGVWGWDHGKGKHQVIDTHDDLDHLKRKHNVSDDRVAKLKMDEDLDEKFTPNVYHVVGQDNSGYFRHGSPTASLISAMKSAKEKGAHVYATSHDGSGYEHAFGRGDVKKKLAKGELREHSLTAERLRRALS